MCTYDHLVYTANRIAFSMQFIDRNLLKDQEFLLQDYVAKMDHDPNAKGSLEEIQRGNGTSVRLQSGSTAVR